MVEQTESLVEESVEKEGSNQEVDSKYRKIILAAQRSKQIQRGATPRIDMDPRKSKSTRIAMQELEAGKINFEVLTEKGEK